MSVEARRATGEAAARDLGELRHRHDRPRRPTGAAAGRCRGLGRPRDRRVRAAAVAARARSRRRRPARPRRPADLDCGSRHRRRRARRVEAVRQDRAVFALRPGRRARAAAAAAAGLRAAEVVLLDLPQLRADAAGAPAARRRPRRALAGTGRGLAQPGRGRLRARHHASGDRRGSGGSSPTSIRGRSSRFDLGNVADRRSAFGSLASVTDVALLRRRQRPRGRERRRASGRCCRSASPS